MGADEIDEIQNVGDIETVYKHATINNMCTLRAFAVILLCFRS